MGAGLGVVAPPAVKPPAAISTVVAARPVVAVAPTRPKAIDNPYGGLIAFDRRPVDPYGALVAFVPDPAPASPSVAPALTANLEVAPPARAPTAPLQVAPSPTRNVAAVDPDVPLPPLRPAELAAIAASAPAVAPVPAVRRPPVVAARIARAPAPPDDGNVFGRLFSLGRSGAVAYAAPDDQAATNAQSPALAAVDHASGSSAFARSATPGVDNLTAVYDISARTVTLPDGTRLEAHSGLGPMLDDPRFVSEHNRGATPPHLYALELRDALFHDVQALRLDPIGGDATVFGRSGLLAHSYMLGPNGDSNGCVSFKDYDAFLRAYQQGRVKRLAVVARAE